MSPFSLSSNGGRQSHFKPAQVLTVGLCMILLAALAAGPVQAEGEVSASLHPCAEDSGGVGSCTANEIDIADATAFFLDLPESVTTCTAGEMLPVREIVAEYGLNTGVRYDPLLWVGRKGNDPRDPDEGMASCYVSSAPAALAVRRQLRDLLGRRRRG